MEPLPRVFVCGSSHDIYGDRESTVPLDESAAEGTDFFGQLYGEIEREARALEAFGVRVVLARFGVVLGQGGNDPRVLPHVVASPFGALSWIHIADAVETLERVLVDESLSGPINITAPRPTTAAELRDRRTTPQQDRRAILRKAIISESARSGMVTGAAPRAPADEDSAAAHVQYQSHWAYPAKLKQAGYRWRVTSISDALEYGETAYGAEPAGLHPSLGKRRTVHETGDIPVSWTEVGSGYPLVICSAAALPLEYWSDLLQFLSVRYRILFLHPRGLWGGHLPAQPHQMSVADHARDLSFLIEHLGLRKYGIVGHCAGVPLIIAGLSLLRVPPRRVLLVSSRLSPGPALANIGTVTGLVRTNPQFRLQYARVAALYAPLELRQGLERQLADVGELEAHIHAVQSVREYAFADVWPQRVIATLAWASTDAEVIRSSMRAYAERLGPCCCGVKEFEGDHFTFLKKVTIGARLVETAFGEEAHESLA